MVYRSTATNRVYERGLENVGELEIAEDQIRYGIRRITRKHLSGRAFTVSA